MMNIQAHCQCSEIKLTFMEMSLKKLKLKCKTLNLIKFSNMIHLTFKKPEKDHLSTSVFLDRLKFKIQEISCN